MRWALGHHHSLEQKDARWLNRQVRLTPPTNLRGLTPLLLVSFWGCLVGWGMGGRNPDAFAWLLSFFKSPPPPSESPLPFQAQNRKGGKERVLIIWADHSDVPHITAGSLPPLLLKHLLLPPPHPSPNEGEGQGRFLGDMLPASPSSGRSDFPRETGTHK